MDVVRAVLLADYRSTLSERTDFVPLLIQKPLKSGRTAPRANGWFLGYLALGMTGNFPFASQTGRLWRFYTLSKRVAIVR